MLVQLRSFAVLAGLFVTVGIASADAYAWGTSSLSLDLFNVGDNNVGGTGTAISESLFSVTNVNFSVSDTGPGFESQSFGGGILDGGFDAGIGEDWSYFGENDTSGAMSSNFGWSDASNTVGLENQATEDTFNEIVYKITNTSKSKNEWFDLDLSDGVAAEVSLDNSLQEYGLDEALQEFGYSNSQGSFTGNVSTNEAYAETGDGLGANLGTEDFLFVQNDITDYYEARLNPGQTVYFTVITENYSQVGAVSTPGPMAAIPFALGFFGARRRRKAH